MCGLLGLLRKNTEKLTGRDISKLAQKKGKIMFTSSIIIIIIIIFFFFLIIIITTYFLMCAS